MGRRLAHVGVISLARNQPTHDIFAARVGAAGGVHTDDSPVFTTYDHDGEPTIATDGTNLLAVNTLTTARGMRLRGSDGAGRGLT